METAIETVWSKSKVLIKGLIIGLIALLLFIPAYYVKNLIEEREQRQKEAISEVSTKWASKQTIAGPILVLPYTDAAVDTGGKTIAAKHFAYFLPDELSVKTTVFPQERSRGIYKVMLYASQTDLSGSFKGITLEKLTIDPRNILWNEAFVKVSVSDPKGLNDELRLRWNDSLLTLSPQTFTGPGNENGLVASIPLRDAEDLKNIRFSASLNINGSEQILFVPAGKTTTVRLKAHWPHPSFTGNTLPQSSTITHNSFDAVWNSVSHKRDFPQQWKDTRYSLKSEGGANSANIYRLDASAFGVNLFIPVNGYQKTMRSVKYASLCILLTFAAFFLIDAVHRKSVHPFQYGLIGLALILFYVLLLSFSEYMDFNLSYGIAAFATIGLVGWFVKGLLSSGKLSFLLSLVLVFVYSYVFAILQLQDYALLLGSVGLFLTLAVIMYFSKRLRW